MKNMGGQSDTRRSIEELPAELSNEPGEYLAQPLWLKEHRDCHYEFALVYDPTGRRDRGRSRWASYGIAPRDARARDLLEPARYRVVTWSRLRRALGRRAPSFVAFSSCSASPEQLEAWFEAAATMPVEQDIELTVDDPAHGPLPWNYLGLCKNQGKWRSASGYIPCDGEDTEGGARDAAEMLDADAVILENARHETISIRGFDGKPIAIPRE